MPWKNKGRETLQSHTHHQKLLTSAPIVADPCVSSVSCCPMTLSILSHKACRGFVRNKWQDLRSESLGY